MTSSPDDETAALRLLEEALHLRQHGERAPGGTETWAQWERKAEDLLRRRLAAAAWRRSLRDGTAGDTIDPPGQPDTDVFPPDIALGEGDALWCVLAEDGGRADCDSKREACDVAEQITATGRRAAIYVRSASRYCYALCEVITEDRKDEGS